MPHWFVLNKIEGVKYITCLELVLCFKSKVAATRVRRRFITLRPRRHRAQLSIGNLALVL